MVQYGQGLNQPEPRCPGVHANDGTDYDFFWNHVLDPK
jgi:hypothetical protein